MKVLVIGLGSMGKRRIRLIQQYDCKIKIIGMDLNAARRKETEEKYSVPVYDSLENALSIADLDCCFICTAPLSHAKIINQCIRAGCHIFSELNLVSESYDENIALAAQKNVVLFLSSTQLYRDELRYIKKCVGFQGAKCNYIYHVGQYLRDWHPWEDYQNYFVSQVKTNACREIMAVELPWLVDCFGKIENISKLRDKKSDLNIGYNDNYMILLEHENGTNGFLCVDILCRTPVRFLEVFNEEMYIKWLGTPESLYEYQIPEKELKQVILYDKVDKLENYNDTIIENDYYSEIEEFFEVVKSNAAARYSFLKDKEILDMIDSIEED